MLIIISFSYPRLPLLDTLFNGSTGFWERERGERGGETSTFNRDYNGRFSFFLSFFLSTSIVIVVTLCKCLIREKRDFSPDRYAEMFAWLRGPKFFFPENGNLILGKNREI